MLLFRWGTNLLKKRVRLFLLIALDGMTPAESFQSPSKALPMKEQPQLAFAKLSHM